MYGATQTLEPGEERPTSLKERAQALKRDIPAVFIAMKKRETPLAAKVLAGLAVAYALSPIDLVPDFIPVIGYVDDILILPALIAVAVKLIPPDVFAACRREAEDLWADGTPRRWYYVLPVLLLWLGAVFFALRLLLPCVQGR